MNVKNIILTIVAFLGITFQTLLPFVWLRTTDEGSVPETSICSVLLIQSDFKNGVSILANVSSLYIDNMHSHAESWSVQLFRPFH